MSAYRLIWKRPRRRPFQFRFTAFSDEEISRKIRNHLRRYRGAKPRRLKQILGRGKTEELLLSKYLDSAFS